MRPSHVVIASTQARNFPFIVLDTSEHIFLTRGIFSTNIKVYGIIFVANIIFGLVISSENLDIL
jgi:hypothetical protein